MTGAWWVLAAAVGCVQVEPAAEVFAPRPVHEATPVDLTLDDEVTDGEAQAEDAEEAEPLTMAEIFEGMGLGDAAELGEAADQTDAEVPATQPAAVTPSETAEPPQAPSWALDGAVENAFGVWLVSTVVDAQPPRAILAVADGGEKVVRAGTMLPDAGVVVLAVGRDSVQVARVTAEGDRAHVETQLLRAMYP